MYTCAAKLNRLYFLFLMCAMASAFPCMGNEQAPTGKRPNFIVIFADDLGYSDLSCYGAKKIKTPVLDQLAEEGVRFTDFLTTCNVCSPSRASLLTGRYPQRCGLPYAIGGPYNCLGLQGSEVTIAKMLKPQGYATVAIGKWHIGMPPSFNFTTHEGFASKHEFHPNSHGFDLFYGTVGNSGTNAKVPLLRNETVVDCERAVATITDALTDQAIAFIEENRNQPFFIYFAHLRPHAPWVANPRLKGKSAAGTYGDMVEEIDESTGRIMQALKDLQIDDNTLVVFTSDHGSAYMPDDRYGSNAPFRGGKGMTWEGGHRVPAIFRWPGQIPPGKVSDKMATTMDLFPTLARLAGAESPNDRVIDGFDIWPLFSGTEGAKSPYKVLYYYQGFNLQAIRAGKWKLHLPRNRRMLPWWETGLMEVKAPMLFNLSNNLGEQHNVAAKHPEVVKRLTDLAVNARMTLGSWDKPGVDQKPIRHLMDDRMGLGAIRNQQGHDKLGKRTIDPTLSADKRKKIEQAVKILRNKLGKPVEADE